MNGEFVPLRIDVRRDGERGRISRRDAIKWMAAAAATISVLDAQSFGVQALPSGIGTDPNLLNPIVPWPRTLTPEQLRTLTVLCDAIIPADDRSPAASSVGVPDFIDEWVSAPYPDQQDDRRRILEGLAWLDDESRRRFNADFASLADQQKTQICDDICYIPAARPQFKQAAVFFTKVRNLTMGAFYTTPQGMADIGYIGNVPINEFPGPPEHVLKYLGLDGGG